MSLDGLPDEPRSAMLRMAWGRSRLIGLVIVTHGRLASELITVWEHVVGPQPAVEAIAIGPEDDMEAIRNDIRQAAARCDDGDGVIVLTDLFGGTPSNLAISLLKSGSVEVVAGVNLPMMISFAGLRRRVVLSEAAAEITGAGRRYISNAREVLGRATTDDADDVEVAIQDALPRAVDEAERLERKLASDLLAHTAAKLVRLHDLGVAGVSSSYGGMGHNRPPTPAIKFDASIIEEGAIAAEVAASELVSLAPRRNVVQLCVAALRRMAKLLEKIIKYLGHKGDKLLDTTLTSVGKAAGPAILTSVVLTQLKGQITAGIEALLKLVHLG